MNLIKYRLVISALVLLLVSCDYNRSNPIINQHIDYSNIITNSAVRDFVIIKDFTATTYISFALANCLFLLYSKDFLSSPYARKYEIGAVAEISCDFLK